MRQRGRARSVRAAMTAAWLAVGMRADLCVLNTDTPQFTPMTSAACNVAYAAQGADIRMTMVDGEVLYRDGEFKTIDIEKVKAEVQRRTDSILSRLQGGTNHADT